MQCNWRELTAAKSRVLSLYTFAMASLSFALAVALTACEAGQHVLGLLRPVRNHSFR